MAQKKNIPQNNYLLREQKLPFWVCACLGLWAVATAPISTEEKNQTDMTHEFSHFFFLKKIINNSDDKLISARNFLGWMILLLCDCKSWSSLANQLYHQSNDETERNAKKEMTKRKERVREKTGELGKNWYSCIYCWRFSNFLDAQFADSFLFHWGYGWPYWTECSNMCSLSEHVYVCVYVVCAHYFQFNSTHRWKKY